MVKNLLIVDLGLIFAFPTILIAAMTGISNEHNHSEYLSITPYGASWLGKHNYFPFGYLKKNLNQLNKKIEKILKSDIMFTTCREHWIFIPACRQYAVGLYDR